VTAARRLARLCWLWLVWMLLWGQLSALAAASGVLVAGAVLLFFPTPGPEPGGGAPGGRARPVLLSAEAARLLAALVPASLVVAWQMIRCGPATRAAIIAVPLRTRSETVAVLVANAISLAPGIAVIHVDRDGGVFYVHALAGRGDVDVEKVRASVDALQRRVTRALGYPGPGGRR
jgi:multicomponent Na+:H+ antiporter subunit E